MFHFPKASPEEGDDACEVASIVALLRKNYGDGGIDCIAKKEGCSSEAESPAVGLDIALNCEGTGDAFLLAHTFSIKVSVTAEMALLGQTTVQKDTEGMVCCAMGLYQSTSSNTWERTVLTRAQSGEAGVHHYSQPDGMLALLKASPTSERVVTRYCASLA